MTLKPGIPPRLADVAVQAGVSLATASRVLNGSDRKVAESYKKRVVSAADELGYVSNWSAQATARGTTPVIALLVGDIADPYFSNIAAGVARKADEVGLVVTIATTNRDSVREAGLLQTLRGQRPRAVILAASRTNEPTSECVNDLVAAGSTVVGLGQNMEENSIKWLGIDNYSGARSLAQEMASIGYSRAIVVAAHEGIHTSDQRLAGFTAGFTGSGGEIIDTYRTPLNREGGSAALNQVIDDMELTAVKEPMLVFAISDVMAIGAMHAIRARDLTIGKHLSVCGFNNIKTAIDVTPELTTVDVPLSELGYQAATRAVDAESALPEFELPVILRDSTPPISKS